MTPNAIATREPTDVEVQAALRVLNNWGGLKNRDADARSIVKTMLAAAAGALAAKPVPMLNDIPGWPV